MRLHHPTPQFHRRVSSRLSGENGVGLSTKSTIALTSGHRAIELAEETMKEARSVAFATSSSASFPGAGAAATADRPDARNSAPG